MQELIATLKLLHAIGDKERGKSYAGVAHHVISRASIECRFVVPTIRA